jgi:hypothetical protein
MLNVYHVLSRVILQPKYSHMLGGGPFISKHALFGKVARLTRSNSIVHSFLGWQGIGNRHGRKTSVRI